MKKVVSIALSFVLLLALAACGKKNDEIVGTWEITTISSYGFTISLSEYAEMFGADEDLKMDFTFSADGKLEGDFLGDKVKGTWKTSANGYVLSFDGEDLDASIKNGVLEMGDDEVTLSLEKK